MNSLFTDPTFITVTVVVLASVVGSAIAVHYIMRQQRKETTKQIEAGFQDIKRQISQGH